MPRFHKKAKKALEAQKKAAKLEPVETIKFRRTEFKKPKFPVIDVHEHFKIQFGEEYYENENLIELLDENNIKAIINLDGGMGEELKANMERYQYKYPGRLYNFINPHKLGAFSDGIRDLILNVDNPEFERKMKKWIKEGVKLGAKGIKLLKDLGLLIRDSKDNLVMPDDERLKVIWETAAEEDIPVLYHVADPIHKFMPVDKNNPNYEKLIARPSHSFYGPEYPTHKQLFDSLFKVLEENPETTFILPHLGYREDLGFVSDLMGKYPNFMIDISAKHNLLGKQPYTSREFFLKHADRILFGQDGSPDINISSGKFKTACAVLETDNEYFNYKPGSPKIHGLYLPDDVLKKVYHENAQKLLGI